jgi:hypothetical protein
MIEARIVKIFEAEDKDDLMEQFTEWVTEVNTDDLEYKELGSWS